MLRRGVRAYLGLRPKSRVEIAHEVDEEIAMHLELRVQHLMALGAAPEDARAEAERRFGEMQRARMGLREIAGQRERSMNMREWFSGWGQDVRYAARALLRQPLLALVIVVTLGLGLGANMVTYGIVEELLLSGPAHVVEPDQVRRVYATSRRGDGERTRPHTAFVVYAAMKQRTSIFSDVAAYFTSRTRMGEGEEAREVPVAWSTHDLFPLLQVQPVLGRFYTEEESRPQQPHYVAVISWDYWQSEYSGAGDVLQRTVRVDDNEYSIIGVAPRGFTGADRRPVSVWMPISTTYDPHPQWPTSWNARWLQVVVRLQAGVSLERIEAEATSAYRSTALENVPDVATASVSLLPIDYTVDGREPAEYAVSRWLAGVSLVVLLVACANVMNLLLARGMKRRRELAIRLAMGISRGRLTRLLLTETLLLAVAGAAVATLLAFRGGRFMRATLLPDVQWATPLSSRLMLFTAAGVVVIAVLIGLAPVLQAGRHMLVSALKSGSSGSGHERSWLRDGLTVLQAALSLILLIGAGLFVRSLWNVRQLDLGIDAEEVLAVWTEFRPVTGLDPEQRAALRERRAAFYSTTVERLARHPDIAAASVAIGTPLQGTFGVDLRVPGWDSIPELAGGGPFIIAAAPGYFETVGTDIVRGRSLRRGEGRGSEAVVIVNETMAATLWPGEDPLTKCMYIGDGADVPCARVVGVAENTRRWELREEEAMQYYVPLGQETGIGGTQLVVRPRGDATAFIPELRRMLHTMAPEAEFFSIDPLWKTIDPEVRPWRLGATMFLVFGGLALMIAAIGLYSVIAYGVTQRRAEIGVRLALGAHAPEILGMILRRGVGLVLLGVAIGIPVALAGGRMLESLLFELSAHDLPTYAAVAGVLALVAVIASALPALRAARTSPTEALRTE